jgi:hypothetical protein
MQFFTFEIARAVDTQHTTSPTAPSQFNVSRSLPFLIFNFGIIDFIFATATPHCSKYGDFSSSYDSD